ncbi:class I SAM-dependent methyltransferase [Archangium lansingense]|uniref:S-adenosyl-L-methionine-dependent methyltransferase n=1 Tax=Archangium lansingense TaxID=2995310 RepID=A0ABT4A2Z9_9BACT|nr:SAM-dependent methyltransferase [Archangium lansinium]MCY1075322.1 SAM-dependent methyltransferase [Archangium lansinium]
MLARQPRLAPLLPKGAAESMERLMLHTGLLKPWMLRLYAAPWYGRLVTSIERHTVPGQVLCVGLRKRFMDDETRAALAEGKRQVLVVGAGLDTLCWRLAKEYPEVTFIELDHPASQAMKREALEGLGPLPPNLHLVGVDLARTSLEEALSQLAAWQKETPSVVIAEAVLMYLKEAHVSTFLEAVYRSTGPGSRLLCTCFRWEVNGRATAGAGTRQLISKSLRLAGEPLLWIVRDGELDPLLARHGFRQDASPERVELHRRYLVPAGLPEVPVSDFEFPVVADKE